MKNFLTWEDFEKVEIRSGTIIDARINEKAKKPAYILTIDFGEIGIKTSSAQITQNHSIHELIGKKILAVTNFAPKLIAGIKSEVLVLATVSEEQGTRLIHAHPDSKNGSHVR